MKLALSISRLMIPLFLASLVSAEEHTGQWPDEKSLQSVTAAQTQPALHPPPPATAPATTNTAAYLGLGLDVLSPSIIAQLPPEISTGQGIIITRFTDDSPARKSGLMVYDILLSYDNTRLIHPEQFIDLVRKDKPGRVVQLKVLRNGKLLTHPVTLGSQQIPQQSTQPNGLVIKQLGKNLYQANIRFIDANGNQQLRQYKGTRQEIYMQAYNARDLPPKDREQILFASGGPRKSQSNSGFGSFFPFGNRNGKNGFGSFFPFGNRNNRQHNNGFGSFFPF